MDYDRNESARRRAEYRAMREREAREARRKRRRSGMKKLVPILLVIVVLAVLILGIIAIIGKLNNKDKKSDKAPNNQEVVSQNSETPAISDNAVAEEESVSGNKPYKTGNAAAMGFFEGYEISGKDTASYISSENTLSNYAVLIDMSTGNVVASRNSDERIAPASMTKILTALVACEQIENLDDTVTITIEDCDYAYSNDLSAVNFIDGDVVTVRDLLYGTILPSGGDAAHALAVYVAGSEEAFVDMMNAKLDELGLSDTTHFTNCAGIFDDNHYCTPQSMAMILKAALENDLCREVLGTRIYTTSPTQEHPEGIEISNWFIRRIEDKDCHGIVKAAKTGFVNESGCCAASYLESNDGHKYICVTADAWSSWRCIYDHVDIYATYCN